MAVEATKEALVDTLDSGRVSYENHKGISAGQVRRDPGSSPHSDCRTLLKGVAI